MVSGYMGKSIDGWQAWFRIFGHGLCIKCGGLLFSERNGYSGFRLGRCHAKFL